MRTTGTLRRRPLRRFREVVCLAAAGLLFAAIWGLAHGAFADTRGHATVVVLGVVEVVALGILFVLEWLRPRRRPALPWITMAWLSLPLWALLEVVAATALRATA